MSVLISMFIFALIGAISPGPVNIIATASGATFGFRKTLPHILGATFSYTLIVFLAGLGLSQSMMASPQTNQLLQYIGGLFLLYIAFKIATSVSINSELQHANTTILQKSPPSFVEGALAQILNPKAWLVSMSGISLFVTLQPKPMLYLFIFCLISFTLCLLGISTWAAIGRTIRGLLLTKQRQMGFNIAMGLMLSGTVFFILFT